MNDWDHVHGMWARAVIGVALMLFTAMALVAALAWFTGY